MRKIIILILLLLIIVVVYKLALKVNLNSDYKVGQAIDSLNHVVVYYNGGVDNTCGRNLAPDNYNLGIKYQCVEFVKRYYYQHLHHKMPDTYGHAKDFFDKSLGDGELNKKRNLLQFKNGSKSKPEVDDLLIFSGSTWNVYGHVAIISDVNDKAIQIIQQNPGPFGKSREVLELKQENGLWKIKNDRILGWLRKDK